MNQILSHLKKCDMTFHIPLSKRVKLLDYSKKIYDNSIRFEAWDDQSLIGLLALYHSPKKRNTGFITNVSVEKNYQGKGIGDKLISSVLEYSKEFEISLELIVNLKSKAALNLYKKHGFSEIERTTQEIVMRFQN